MIRSRTRSSKLEANRRARTARVHRRCADRAPPSRAGAEARRPAHARRTRAPRDPPAAAARQRPASTPRPDRATARHRRRTAADAAQPLPIDRLSTARPDEEPIRRRPRAQPEHNLDSASRCGPGRFVEPVEQRPAQLMQAGEGQLHRPTPPPPPARPSDPTPRRSGSPAAPSSRSQPRRAAPATGSRRDGSPRPARPAARTRSPGRAGRAARPVRENGRPSLRP